MIKEEIKNIKESPKDLRNFGITIGLSLILLSAYLLFRHKESFEFFLAAGIVLIVIGLTYPAILKPLNKVWMTLAILLGWITTRVILIILFYIVLTPTALIAKILKKDFLQLGIDKQMDSYWEKRDPKKITAEDFDKQF